jgi:nucleotide-binding universal stress UspA family protein
MFKRILLAYEGSPETEAALSQAAELALLCKAELHLLGVCAATGTAALLQMDGAATLQYKC